MYMKKLLKLFASKKKVRKNRTSSGFMKGELSKMAKLQQGLFQLGVGR